MKKDTFAYINVCFVTSLSHPDYEMTDDSKDTAPCFSGTLQGRNSYVRNCENLESAADTEKTREDGDQVRESQGLL